MTRISHLGVDALLFDPAGASFDEELQRRIWGFAKRLVDDPAVTDATCGVNNLLVRFRPDAIEPDELAARLTRLWSAQAPDPGSCRRFEAPTVYGGELGPDLEGLARRLGVSGLEIARLHAGPIYSVAAVGAMPGFVYLSGLDSRLAWPRLETPRPALAAGSVIIGGAQAGVMPMTAPSGWRSLGVTALELFDIAREAPALLRPGDVLKFEIERVEA